MGKALLEFQYQMETYECANCCMVVALPGRFVADRRRDHQTFYCPQGHANYFPSKSDVELLRDEVAKKERQLEIERSRLTFAQKEAEHAERRRRSMKAVLTKTKARLVAGKCPRCSKSFPDLAEHLKTHPELCERQS